MHLTDDRVRFWRWIMGVEQSKETWDPYILQGYNQNVRALQFRKSLCPIRKMHVYNSESAFFGLPKSDVLLLIWSID